MQENEYICEERMELPAEHERNVIGQFDEYVKKMERTLGVTVISRDGQLKILGPGQACQQAVKIFTQPSGIIQERKYHYRTEYKLCLVPGSRGADFRHYGN